MDEALGQAEESVRLNPRRLRFTDPAAGLREGVDTLERAATDMRVLARSVADSARIDSEDSPVKEAETRARLAAVLAELAAAVRAYGQLIEAEPAEPSRLAAETRRPSRIAEELEDHLEEAQRQQDRLADVLRHRPGRTSGRLAAARRDPGPRGPAAQRTGAQAAGRPRTAAQAAAADAAPPRGPGPGRGPDRRSPASPVWTASTLWPSGSRRNTA